MEDDDLVAEAEVEAELIDPQSRPWWQEEAVVAGVSDHIVVPDLKGLSLAQVLKVIEKQDLKVRIDGSGVVRQQKPQAGALVPGESLIKIGLGLPGDAVARRTK
jgi:hypothetical protein